MNKINRKKFFGTVGKNVFIAAIASVIPYKFFSSVVKASDKNKKKIKTAIHPSAVKRTNKG
ncbi:MAG: hypothetical protein AB1298_01075 [Bacteroidota bacterium]